MTRFCKKLQDAYQLTKQEAQLMLRQPIVQEYDRLKEPLHDIYFNAIHCDRSISTCD